MQLGEGYRKSDPITIARCDINTVQVQNVYNIPTIKLYPAHDKTLPVEYFPVDYSRTEGYRKFIEEEGSLQVQWRAPSPIVAG